MGIINGKRAKIEELKQEIALLEEQKQQTENDIEIWLSDWKLKERANELGYIYTTDK